HRQWTVEKIGSGERQGRQIGGLHELEGGLARRRVGVAAAGGHEPVGEAVASGQLGGAGAVEDVVGPLGELRGGSGLGGVNPSGARADALEEQEEREEVGGVGL